MGSQDIHQDEHHTALLSFWLLMPSANIQIYEFVW